MHFNYQAFQRKPQSRILLLKNKVQKIKKFSKLDLAQKTKNINNQKD